MLGALGHRIVDWIIHRYHLVALDRRREQSGLTILDTHEHLTSRTNQQLSILTHLSERNAELVTLRSEIKYSG